MILYSRHIQSFSESHYTELITTIFFSQFSFDSGCSDIGGEFFLLLIPSTPPNLPLTGLQAGCQCVNILVKTYGNETIASFSPPPKVKGVAVLCSKFYHFGPASRTALASIFLSKSLPNFTRLCFVLLCFVSKPIYTVTTSSI